jgi:hypothetical protein
MTGTSQNQVNPGSNLPVKNLTAAASGGMLSGTFDVSRPARRLLGTAAALPLAPARSCRSEPGLPRPALQPLGTETAPLPPCAQVEVDVPLTTARRLLATSPTINLLYAVGPVKNNIPQ